MLQRSGSFFDRRRAALLTLGAGVLCLLVSACGSDPVSGQAPSAVATPTDAYQLGSGDKMRITVFGQKDMTGEYQIDGAGNVDFPLIGRVHAGGGSPEQLSHAIEAKLSPDYIRDPHVNVEVLSFRPFYVVGEVQKPGSYAYVSGMTVLNAVALAGGYTYRANENAFVVERSEKNGTKDRLSATTLTPLLPGDVVTVRERYF